MARDYNDYIDKSVEVESLNVYYNTWLTPLASQVWTDTSALDVLSICNKEVVGRLGEVHSPSGFAMTDAEQHVLWREGKVAMEDALAEAKRLLSIVINVKTEADRNPEAIRVVYQLVGARALQSTNVTSSVQIAKVFNKYITKVDKIYTWVPEDILKG